MFIDKNIFLRRQFLKFGTLGSLTFIPMLDWACNHNESVLQTGSWIDQMIQFNDLGIPVALKNQHTDSKHPQYGGIPDAYLIYNRHAPAGLIQYLTCAYTSPGSQYFQDSNLLVRMELSIDFILRKQHADGTIDLLTTNFHSTPDVAFVVEPIALSYKLLIRHEYAASLSLREKIKSFLLRAGDALSVGGIHTPNHRWVVCMALARINEFFPSKKYTDRIQQWLDEKIDIDADGQYNEQSTSVYSPMSDRWLITIADLMDKPELYDPVRKNLDMTLYLIHPNGDLVTEMSRRQDQYSIAPSLSYFYAYHHIAMYSKDEKYKMMAWWLFSNYGVKALSGNLAYLLENKKLWIQPTDDQFPLDRYERYFEHSKLVRWREGTLDATLVAQNPILFSMHHAGIVLQAVRCASAFFGKGQFIGDQLKKTTDGYEIYQKLEGPYFQPFPPDSLPDDGDWDNMPRDRRPQSEVQHMEYKLNVIKVEHGFQLKFSLTGTAGVPVAIELSFRKNRGDVMLDVDNVPTIEDAFLLKNQISEYKSSDQSIWIKGGLHQHDWTSIRGALPKLQGHSYYITGYTPFEQEVSISTQKFL